MPEADEIIITRFIVETSEAIESTQEFRAQIDTIKEQLKTAAKETGESFEVVSASIKRVKIKEFQKDIADLQRQIKEGRGVLKDSVIKNLENDLRRARMEMAHFKEASTRALREVNQEAGKLQGGFRGFLSSLTGGTSNFGNIAQFVFGSIIGVTAVQAFQRLTRAFVDFAKEILQRGEEMSATIFTFEVAIRGLQRVGLDTTIEGWTDRLQDLKKEFPFFPKKEFIEAASLASLMTREFGFTEKQIANIVRQSSILAQITGKDLLESVRGITFAIGSGYFESLQRAGINISRQVVANEALAQGYEGVYNELEPTIRASVTYSVIQNNLNAIQADASKLSETFAGQLRILNSELEDLKNLFGEVVSSSDSFIESLKIINELVASIRGVYESLAGLNIDIFAPLKEILGINQIIRIIEDVTTELKVLANVIEALGTVGSTLSPVVDAIVTVANALGFEGVANTIEEIREALFNLGRSLGDLDADFIKEFEVGDVQRAINEQFIERVNLVSELAEEIAEEEEKLAEKIIDININLQRDLDKITIDGARKRRDAIRKNTRNLAKLEEDLQRSIDRAIEDAAKQRAQVERQFALRRQQLEDRYRQNEIKAERDFQEKMRRLREEFLFDLEDAVRERDARQIIRLIRRFNLDKAQAKREFEDAEKDRSAQFKIELENLEAQRQERLRVLEEELAFRIARMQQDAEFRKQQEEQRFQDEMDDIKRREDQRKMDAEQRAQDRRDDAARQAKDRIADLEAEFIEEHNVTTTWAKAIRQALEDEFGPGGNIDLIYNHFIGVINAINESIRRMGNYQFLAPQVLPNYGAEADIDGFAQGGIALARKPSMLLFGEAGPEVAQLTPLNQLGNQQKLGGQLSMDKNSPMGMIRMEMLLSPDLEARIVDQTLNEVADVTFTIERERA